MKTLFAIIALLGSAFSIVASFAFFGYILQQLMNFPNLGEIAIYSGLSAVVCFGLIFLFKDLY